MKCFTGIVRTYIRRECRSGRRRSAFNPSHRPSSTHASDSTSLKMETPTASCPGVAAAAAAVSVSRDDGETPSISTSNNDPIFFTIKFQPGPLGMNLKPVRSEAIIDEGEGSGPPGKKEIGCQIMSFVENSATKRSQARGQSLRQGDVVTRVGDADVTNTLFHDIVDQLKRKDVDDKGMAVGKSITFKRLPKKRGRPIGSKNKNPAKKRKVTKRVEKEPEWKSNRDKNKCLAAKRLIGDKVKVIDDANETISTYEKEIAELQKKIEAAKKTVESSKKDLRVFTAAKANDLVLEPTEWNEKYEQLLKYKEKHGDVSHLSVRNFPENMSKEDIAIHKRMAKFLSKSRTAKKEGTLDLYKEILLDQLGINWNPSQGPTGEKWQRNFEALVEFKRIHGHLDVPKHYPAYPRLSEWVKTQITQYHAKQDGKKHLLSDEREKLMSDLGVQWPPKRVTTSWETRYQELLNYKQQHGHPNVPWQWKTNRPLAAWVNAQRKKYVELQKGRKTNLTEENIRLLDEIGFRWQTNNSPAKKASGVSEPEVVAIAAAAAAAATVPAEPYQSTDMTTDEAHGLLALSGFPDFGANI